MTDKGVKIFVTGQQLGLLGGPLYTTYKVLGAHYHAEQCSGRAVYWLETNDADFNEINHIDFIDSKGELKSLKWDIDSKGYSCGSIPVDDKLIRILKEFFDLIVETEYTDKLKRVVFDSYVPGGCLARPQSALRRRSSTDLNLNFLILQSESSENLQGRY